MAHPDALGRAARRQARRDASLGTILVRPAGWGAKHTRAAKWAQDEADRIKAEQEAS